MKLLIAYSYIAFSCITPIINPKPEIVM